MTAAVPAQLPNLGPPPAGSPSLGLALLFRILSLPDGEPVLLGMTLHVVNAAAGFVLQNKLKQTVIDHFAYKVKHGNMN